MLNRKRVLKRGAAAYVAALVLLAAAAFSGCGKDKPGDQTGLGAFAIRVSELIVSPRSPLPGDTVTCAAIIIATDGDGNPVTNPGDFPSLQWRADGGQFLDNNKLTVRWVAPDTSALFLITCEATNAVNKAQRDADVFVSTPVVVVPSGAGEIRMLANGTDFFYAHSDDPTTSFDVW